MHIFVEKFCRIKKYAYLCIGFIGIHNVLGYLGVGVRFRPLHSSVAYLSLEKLT